MEGKSMSGMPKTNQTTLCYIENDDSYLMMHRVKKENDINKDKWIGVGGHFEKDETPQECLLREVYEETGLKISPDEFSLIGISDTGKERNVTLRYIAVLHGEKPELPSVESLKGLGGEENEVSEIKWIDINFLDKYKWAFNHDKVIEKTLMEAYQYQKAQQIAKQTIENK